MLDIGCGDGTLLRLLAEKRGVDGRGIELSQAGVNSCVAQGLSVIQGDADTDLVYYPDLAFDYAILSQTIQATYAPRDVLEAAVAHRQAGRGVLPQFRPLAGAGAAAVRRPDADRPTICRTAGTTRPTSISAPSRISSVCAKMSAPRVERAVALNAYGHKLGVVHAAVRAESVRRAGGVPAVALSACGVTPAGTGTMRRRTLLVSRAGMAA